MMIHEPIPPSDMIGYGEVLPPDATLLPSPWRSLDRMLFIMRRWWPRFLAVFAAFVLLGLLSVLVLPLRYTAQALVVVGSRAPNPLLMTPNTQQSKPQEPDVDGVTALLTSPLALQRVIEDLKLAQRPEFARLLHNTRPGIVVRLRNALFGADTSDASKDPVAVIATVLGQHLKVSRIGRSAVVRVEYTDADPILATDIANAAARNSAIDQEFRQRLPLIERAGFDLPKAWVASPAGVPLMPSSPDVLVIMLAAVVGGIGAAFSAVLLADHRATQIIFNIDQISSRGVRALGLIPDYGGTATGQSPVAIVAHEPGELFSDSIAALQASLLPLVPQGTPQCLVLLFGSALPFEGKSTTVAALAASIARSGARVLVIDADLRAPSLHRAFGASRSRGLSNCLDSGVELDSLIQVDPVTRVALLTAGPSPARPLDVLSAGRLHRAIQSWRGSFDFILIDAPPVLTVADARLMAPAADYCVFVARWGKTSCEALGRGLDRLTDAGARIGGVVMSRVDIKQLEDYGFADSLIYGRAYDRYGRYREREGQA